jgi:hypothetical protein
MLNDVLKIKKTLLENKTKIEINAKAFFSL